MPYRRDPSERDMFYLPKYQFRTAVNFCLQYPEIKAEYETLDGSRAITQDGMPHGSGTSDPTMVIADRRAHLSKKLDIIEDAVTWASRYSNKKIARHLLLAVTIENMTFDRLKREYKIPIDKNQFTKFRRMIYWKVAQKIC